MTKLKNKIYREIIEELTVLRILETQEIITINDAEKLFFLTKSNIEQQHKLIERKWKNGKIFYRRTEKDWKEYA